MNAHNTLTVLVVLWLLSVVLLVVLVVDRVQDEARQARCAAMGETWSDGGLLPDGSTMPGQCVDSGATV